VVAAMIGAVVKLIELGYSCCDIKITSFLNGVILVYTKGYALKRTHQLTLVVYLINPKS